MHNVSSTSSVLNCSHCCVLRLGVFHEELGVTLAFVIHDEFPVHSVLQLPHHRVEEILVLLAEKLDLLVL